MLNKLSNYIRLYGYFSGHEQDEIEKAMLFTFTKTDYIEMIQVFENANEDEELENFAQSIGNDIMCIDYFINEEVFYRELRDYSLERYFETDIIKKIVLRWLDNYLK